jgi:hypothetical protein
MSVTIKTIQGLYPHAIVKQVDSKQMFIITVPSGTKLLSYKTIVGLLLNDVWMLTPNKHSRTTSKQLTQFARGRIVHWCNEVEWDDLLMK